MEVVYMHILLWVTSIVLLVLIMSPSANQILYIQCMVALLSTENNGVHYILTTYWHCYQRGASECLVVLLNSLPTNDGKCRHDLCELSISLRKFIWGF